MALINVAGIMAARGFRVLVIDMDLEAPGLSFLANPSETEIPAARKQPGVVDFLLDAVESTDDADFFKLAPVEIVERYSAPYELPEGYDGNSQGSLRIMPAGALDVDYPRRLERLDLPGLYRAGTGLPLFEAFKQTIRESLWFDYVLIDSRTGFSDESGICTRDLADCLIVVSGLNKQNVEGTARLLATLRRSTNAPKLLEIVLSPIPNGEDALVDEREARAGAVFGAAWGSELRTDLHIPYHPRLALTKEPHIFRRRRGDLFDAYHKIERRLRELLGHTTDTWLAQALDAYRAEDYGSALAILQRTKMVADTPNWADRFALMVRLDEAGAGPVFEFVVSELSMNARAEIARRIGGVAKAITEKKNITETDRETAKQLYLRALDANPTFIILWKYALFLWEVCKDLEAAEAMFIKALAVDPDEADALAFYGPMCIYGWMYIYCCGGPQRREEALSKLKTLVEHFNTSQDFSGVIQQARVLEHPHQQWLPVLADVLARRQPSTALAEWDAWRRAPSEWPVLSASRGD